MRQVKISSNCSTPAETADLLEKAYRQMKEAQTARKDFPAVFLREQSDRAEHMVQRVIDHMVEAITAELDGTPMRKAMPSRNGLVMVRRTVTNAKGTYQNTYWVKPDEVKDTDVVMSKDKPTKPSAKRPAEPNKDKASKQKTPDKAAKTPRQSVSRLDPNKYQGIANPVARLANMLQDHGHEAVMEWASSNDIKWEHSDNPAIDWFRCSNAIVGNTSDTAETDNAPVLGKDGYPDDRFYPAVGSERDVSYAGWNKMRREFLKAAGCSDEDVIQLEKLCEAQITANTPFNQARVADYMFRHSDVVQLVGKYELKAAVLRARKQIEENEKFIQNTQQHLESWRQMAVEDHGADPNDGGDYGPYQEQAQAAINRIFGWYDYNASVGEPSVDTIKLYRKGDYNQTILSFTTDSKGVTIGQGSAHSDSDEVDDGVQLVPDHSNTLSELATMGITPVVGFGAIQNTFGGESTEVICFKVPDLDTKRAQSISDLPDEIRGEAESKLNALIAAMDHHNSPEAFTEMLEKQSALMAAGDMEGIQKLMMDYNSEIARIQNEVDMLSAQYGVVINTFKLKSTNQIGYTSREYDYSRESLLKNKSAEPFTTKQAADAAMRPITANVWKSLTDEQKQALRAYTGPQFRKINMDLRQGISDTAETSNLIAQAIDKSVLPVPTKLSRWTDDVGFHRLLGISPEQWKDIKSDPSKLIGMTGTDKGFMSTSAVATDLFENDVQMSIDVPAGTHALYVEPFSARGKGDPDWDGETEQDTWSDEMEVVLQRGTTVRVTDAKYEGGMYHITAEIVKAGDIE